MRLLNVEVEVRIVSSPMYFSLWMGPKEENGADNRPM
jgi:hypothetical protein